MNMFAYYFDLALRSLKRHPALTALMVVAIGFGVAASMITYSVFRAVSGNPIPDKSAQLFTPQIDSWGPQLNLQGEPPQALDYTDAMALMRAHAAKRRICRRSSIGRTAGSRCSPGTGISTPNKSARRSTTWTSRRSSPTSS